MEHIKRNFNLETWIRPSEWTRGGGQRPKCSFSSEYGQVAYYVKGSDEYSNLQANSLSLKIFSTPSGGVKGQTFFSERSYVASTYSVQRPPP